MTCATHWEYREESLPDNQADRHAILENLGSFRWELISVDQGIAYFKREAPDLSDAIMRMGEHMIRMSCEPKYAMAVRKAQRD